MCICFIGFVLLLKYLSKEQKREKNQIQIHFTFFFFWWVGFKAVLVADNGELKISTQVLMWCLYWPLIV